MLIISHKTKFGDSTEVQMLMFFGEIWPFSAYRYDWHQTSTHVLISIYAKVCDPEKCTVEANETNVIVT